MSECPCGSGQAYEACCEPIIAGTAPAATAEALMRSRYSAYVKHAYDHLRVTLAEAERNDFSPEQAKSWSESSDWLGLKILRTEAGGPGDDAGIVEFNARFRAGGKEHDHHEVAKFAREDGRWVYAGLVEEKIETFRREMPKVGRNDPCPCGSGRKYKKCCGAAA
jgi:SEC-C motif-containing protein